MPQSTSRSLVHITGIQAESLMHRGALVPDSTILRLILSELTSNGWLTRTMSPRMTLSSMAASVNPLSAFSQPAEDNFITPPPEIKGVKDEYTFSESPDASFILDGFPRTATQAQQLDALIPINLVVDIKTPTSIIMDRICNRWIHAPSGRTYNLTFNAPKVEGKDDITGEPLTQRADDRPEVWENRLKQFEDISLPLLEHYDKLGVLWRVEGNSSDEISPKLFKEFESRFSGGPLSS